MNMGTCIKLVEMDGQEEEGAVMWGLKIPERVVSISPEATDKLTKPPSVFSIIQANIYQTSQAVFHNVGNGKLKLFSLDFVSKNRG
jgi:hypothetical protein